MKLYKLALIILVILCMAGLAYADTVTPKVATKDALANKPGMKAERGIKNILFGWTDIPKSIIQVTKDSGNPIWGVTGGVFKGIGKAFPRTVSGVADVISFPLGDYDKMPVKPDEFETQIN